MNKKILLPIITSLPLIAVISCSSPKEEILHWAINNHYYLIGSQIEEHISSDENFIQEHNNVYFAERLVANEEVRVGNENKLITVVDSIDSIFSPQTILVDQENFDILKNIDFYKDAQLVSVRGSSLVKFSFDNSDWQIDKQGVITKFSDVSPTAELTISVGSVAKTVKCINRKKIINQNVSNSFAAAKGIPINGCETTTTFERIAPSLETADQYNLLNVSYVDSVGPRVDSFFNVYSQNANEQIIVDGTIANIGLLFYVPKEMARAKIWFRSGWNDPVLGDSSKTVVDFGVDQIFDEGWNLLQIPLDSSKLNLDKNYLTVIRPIQLSANSLTGKLYIGGIFQSDEEMQIKDLIASIKV